MMLRNFRTFRFTRRKFFFSILYSTHTVLQILHIRDDPGNEPHLTHKVLKDAVAKFFCVR
jgi:hypothetical protein